MKRRRRNNAFDEFMKSARETDEFHLPTASREICLEYLKEDNILPKLFYAYEENRMKDLRD